MFSPRVRILGPPLVLTQTENTGGVTSNTCCLNARVLWAWEALWRLHSSGMTSLRHVLGLSMHRRCCLRHFLLIVPLLWLPRLVLCRSSSTLLLPWDAPPPLAHEVAVCVTSRGVVFWCVGCGVHGAAPVGVGVGQPSPSCLVVRPFVVALPTVWSFVCAGVASCAYSCSAHVRPCAQGRCGRCPPRSGVMSDSYFYFAFLPHPGVWVAGQRGVEIVLGPRTVGYKDPPDNVTDVCSTYMWCPPHITGPDPGISARLMHVACMPHTHLTTRKRSEFRARGK